VTAPKHPEDAVRRLVDDLQRIAPLPADWSLVAAVRTRLRIAAAHADAAGADALSDRLLGLSCRLDRPVGTPEALLDMVWRRLADLTGGTR
jgi:hypothetical protein